MFPYRALAYLNGFSAKAMYMYDAAEKFSPALVHLTLNPFDKKSFTSFGDEPLASASEAFGNK